MRNLLLALSFAFPMFAPAGELGIHSPIEAKATVSPVQANRSNESTPQTVASRSPTAARTNSPVVSSGSRSDSLSKARIEPSSEPESYVLMLAGLGAMCLIMSRRNRP